MAKLSAGQRNSMKSSSFALPGKGKGASGKGTGAYPINDKGHAKAALMDSKGKAAAGPVRAAVARKYPGMLNR